MTKTPNQQIMIAKLLDPEVQKVINKLSQQLDGVMPYGTVYQAIRQGMLTAFELGDDMGWVVRAEQEDGALMPNGNRVWIDDIHNLPMREIQDPPKPATHFSKEQIQNAIEKARKSEIDQDLLSYDDYSGEAG